MNVQILIDSYVMGIEFYLHEPEEMASSISYKIEYISGVWQFGSRKIDYQGVEVSAVK